MADTVRINEMQDTLTRLADQVARLTTDLSSLWPNVTGLLADEDGPHQAYLGGTGTAVRASCFVDAQDENSRRMKELEEANQNLEATVAMIAETLNEQQVNQQKQAESMNSPKSDFDATSNRASMNPDRRG